MHHYVSANHTKQESRKKHDKSQHWHSAMLEQKHVLRPKSNEKQPHNDNSDFDLGENSDLGERTGELKSGKRS